ncbi:MAG TPA: metal-dependent transcriptional regulator [Gemmatimonadota bacterium]|nr:metal-dependent transcriptional regulator [Gemmatimonadota bacterium]
MPTSTVEDYLKQLYLAHVQSGGDVMATGELASAMGVVPGTATSMIKALADSGLVDYEPRKGARLTERGEQLALHVLRRHRLVELFLVEVLGLDWAVVHDEADTLEHAISDRVLERIDAILGHPEADPHGDPIPTHQGHVREPAARSLVECPAGQSRRVVRVTDQSPEFLTFADRHGLTPGAVVTVLEREAASGAMQLKGPAGEVVALGLDAAARILAEPIEE